MPVVAQKLQTLMDVGLTYIRLGQNATTLSGGEAQRVKLAKELSKRDTGNTLYILDEPTTGLHFHDIEQLLAVLHRLRDRGNTVVVIEHNLDVIKTADWVIDLGPEGGDGGGEIIATGTPENVAATKGSFTGEFLKPLVNRAPQNAPRRRCRCVEYSDGSSAQLHSATASLPRCHRDRTSDAAGAMRRARRFEHRRPDRLDVRAMRFLHRKSGSANS